VYLVTMLARMAFDNSAPIVQLLICAPLGLLLGGAVLLLFRRSRESSLYAFNAVKGALVEQWSRA